VVVTNPPFGLGLKIPANDARLSRLDIAQNGNGEYRNLEIGLIFLQRAYELLRPGGRLGIIMPETYFFSTDYRFVLDWIRPRLKPKLVLNVPMEAFQGFARAKTNFYVFEKIDGGEDANG
jgi:type I restriction enzyme M protein